MRKIKVWDAAVRLGHWAMGALVLGAFLTSGEDEWTTVHTRLGLALLGIVVFRVVWGVVGPRHARFGDFVRSPRAVLAYARGYLKGKAGHYLGHNPLGGAMVVALLGTLALVTLTGVLVYLGPEWDGPLSGVLTRSGAHAIKEVHEAAAWALPWMVGLHVLGVIASSLLERQNLVKGMITGWKQAPDDARLRPEPSRLARAAGFVAAVAMGGAVVFAVLRLMPVGEAEAATPQQSLLERYAADAKKADPAFKAFDPARGKALYLARGQDGKTSCATCHTADPTQTGRSPAGKVIQPMAPSANPERFTDERRTEKWFNRNCKQVMGRPCTAREKGDFLAWLLSI